MNSELKTITRESIETALILLLKEKPLREISISELAARAGVSRAAFYRNYKDKNEVLNSYLLKTLEEVEARCWAAVDRTHDFESYWLEMFREWKNLSETFSLIDNPQLNSVIQNSINRRSDYFVREDFTMERYREYMLFGAMTNVTREWIGRGMIESPEEMAHFCNSVISVNRVPPQARTSNGLIPQGTPSPDAVPEKK